MTFFKWQNYREQISGYKELGKDRAGEGAGC